MSENPLEDLKDALPLIEEKIGYYFEVKDHLILAFVHRSFVNEYKHLIDQHNERLEYLGDAVLNLIVSDYLFGAYLEDPEGELSKKRASLVDAKSCASYLQKLELEEYFLLGKGEKQTQDRGKETIYADLFESIIGAIYTDGGFLAAQGFFLHHFLEDMEQILESPSLNFKADLQIYTQKKIQKTPEYLVVKATGPDHRKIFQVVVQIEGQEIGRGEGLSKKVAEQKAAKQALEKIKEQSE